MARIGREFFDRQSPVVARDVLGTLLVSVADGVRISGIIVETEAYRGSGDAASHAFRGRTRRNEVMFGEPGRAYVYFTYGSSFCLNLTCEPKGIPAAVLVRALQPTEGVEKMKENRETDEILKLTSGPGRLAEALGIDANLNGEDLVTSEKLFLEEGIVVGAIANTTRVGITKGREYRWRFFVRGNEFVSKGRPSSASQNA